MRIPVTGGAGRTGSHLVEACPALGHEDFVPVDDVVHANLVAHAPAVAAGTQPIVNVGTGRGRSAGGEPAQAAP